MSKGLSGDSVDTQAPGSRGGRVYPSGWGPEGASGSAQGDVFVQGAPAAREKSAASAASGRSVSGAAAASELESLLSVGFGEHAGEIARRVTATPAGASVPGQPAHPAALKGAAPLSADLLPQREQRSTRDQLTMLLSVTFGSDAERLAENLVETRVAAETVASAPLPTRVSRPVSASPVRAALSSRASSAETVPGDASIGSISLVQATAAKPLLGVDIDLSNPAPAAKAQAAPAAKVQAAPAAKAPGVAASMTKAPVAAVTPPIASIPLSMAPAVKKLLGADIDLGAPAPAGVPAASSPVAAAPPATPVVASATSAPAASSVGAPANVPASETALHCASTPARKPQGDGKSDGPSGRDGAGRDGSGSDSVRAKAAKPAARSAGAAPKREAPAPARQAAAADDSSGWPWALFLTAVTGTAIYGWLMRDTGYLAPDSGPGYYLGIIGCSVMISLLLYPMRKKLAFMRNMGKVKYWFQTHMVAGVLGPLAIVFHANFQLGSTNSNVALFTMLTVASSGLLGRFMYTKIHHGLYGRRATMTEMRGGLSTAHGALEAELSFDATVVERFDRLEKWLIAPTGFLGRLWRYLTVGIRTRWIHFRIRRQVRAALSARAAEAGWDRARLASNRRTVKRHLREYFHSIHHVAEFGVYERIFGLWHLLHFPLFLMMAFAAIIHVLAVHMY